MWFPLLTASVSDFEVIKGMASHSCSSDLATVMWCNAIQEDKQLGKGLFLQLVLLCTVYAQTHTPKQQEEDLHCSQGWI